MSFLPFLRLRCCVFQSRRNSAALVIKLKFGVVFGAGGQITACSSLMATVSAQSADDDDLTALRLVNVAGNEVIRYAAVIY